MARCWWSKANRFVALRALTAITAINHLVTLVANGGFSDSAQGAYA
eukprot:COSAG02_NODE_1353_length_13103_cov_74.629652_8_plen_46_part_00